MMSNEGLKQLKEAIMELGYDEVTAADYAARIGPGPIRDQDDKVIVLGDAGEVLAKLELKLP